MKSAWLSVLDAVRAIGKACGVSVGAACVILTRSCGSDVRSRQRPWPEPDRPLKTIYDHWGPPIPPDDWRGASLDLEHGWLVLAGGVIMRGDIEINGDDLCAWITQHEIKKADLEERPKRTANGGKRGPKSVKLETTIKRMHDDIAAGRETETQLRDMKQIALAATYGVNRDTARKARDAVLRSSVANSIADK
jgi:hypothetical protein